MIIAPSSIGGKTASLKIIVDDFPRNRWGKPVGLSCWKAWARIQQRRALIGIPGAVVIRRDVCGDWGQHFGGIVGTLQHVEKVRGRCTVQYGRSWWENTSCPWWCIDLVDLSSVGGHN